MISASRSKAWLSFRPLWFRLPRIGRIIWILSSIIIAPYRCIWPFDPGRIHAILLVRDLYSPLEPMVQALLRQGIKAFHILLVDSGSTAPRCLAALDLLQAQGCRWIKLTQEEQRYGPYAPWCSHRLRQEIRNWHYPYVVTDPDLVVPASIPSDWLFQLFSTLNHQRWALKVALPLSIDSLTTPDKNAVILHERQLGCQVAYRWLTQAVLRRPIGRLACPTDTTLALYRPARLFSSLSVRLESSYRILHLPWYSSFVSSDEYRYYQAHKLQHFGQWSSSSSSS